MALLNNRAKILEIIRSYGPMSIKDVAALCSLSIPSTTAVIDYFLEKKLLLEETSTENISGRPPKLIYINPDYGFVAGIDFGMIGSVSVGFFGMDGAIITKQKISLSPHGDGNGVINNIIDEMKAVIDGFAGKRGALLTVVIGNPGIVNAATGSLRNAAHSVSWAHLPINRLFSKAFGVEVITLNDINLSALGEKMCGAGKGYQNSIFVRVDIGLKAGIIINNSLYRGETGAAGEIGSNVIICKNTDTGKTLIDTVESMLSLDAVIQRISDSLPEHPSDILNALVGADKSVTMEHIQKALGSENSYVCDIVKETGTLLGYVIANIAATLDIGIVIVGGNAVKLNHHIFKPMREAVASVMSPPPTIISSILGEDVALWGAASMGLEHVIQKLAEQSAS